MTLGKTPQLPFMKFMDQPLFDVIALTLARAKLRGDEQHDQMRAGIWNAYGATFAGDDLWLSQAVDAALNILRKFPSEKWGEYYAAAGDYRRTLDREMKPLSWIARIAGGTLFSPSHPLPQERVTLCEQNVLRCLMVITLAEVRQMD